jgi:2-oxoglutarate ferredoxin oxidoreductase subunit beta
MLLSYGVTFIARGFSSDVKQVAKLLQEAVAHKGFSIVHLVSPCPTFNQVITFDFMKQRVAPIPDDHDPSSIDAAFRLALNHDRFYTGVFYRTNLPTMEEKLESQRRMTMDREPRSLEKLFQLF